MTLEQSIRNLVAAKGYKMADIAAKMGVTQSNLLASIRRNPKLSTILELSRAIGCSITDIIQPTNNSTGVGLTIINGVTYKLTPAEEQDIQLPAYNDHQELRAVIRQFVKLNAQEGASSGAICGMVDLIEVFTLMYDHHHNVLHLVLCYGRGETIMLDYDLSVDGNPVDTGELANQVIADIEGAVIDKYRERQNAICVDFLERIETDVKAKTQLENNSLKRMPNEKAAIINDILARHQDNN